MESAITYYKVQDTQSFAALEKPWKALLGKASKRSIFLSWEWMYTWWECYHQKHSDWKLSILVFKKNEEIVAILPLYESTLEYGIFRIRRVGFLGDQIESSDYLDIITTEKYYTYFRSNINEILHNEFSHTDMIHFTGILEDSVIHDSLMGWQNGTVLKQEFRICPYIPLPQSFDDYLKTLSSNFRYNIRRRTKKILKLNDAAFNIISKPEEVSPAIEKVFDLHSVRARQKSLDTKFLKEIRHQFHQRCAVRMAQNDWIKIFLLNIEKKAIATLYCFDYQNTLYYFQSGFDPQWDKMSPGMVIMAYAIRYAIENKMNIFDFMRGNEAYKFNWTDKFYYLYELYKPLSFKGSLLLKSMGVKRTIANLIKSTPLIK
ncbi:MAG: GNAT family N-acetyltransferase [Calditrichaeota bacterium]|nr:MAG: GNAT family N-acetyltransferase [Calditrichota bacterium]